MAEPGSTESLPLTVVDAPLAYVKSLPGKGVRSRLIDGFNVWLQNPPEVVTVVKSVVDDLHTASLIMDDVEDKSPLRRGSPATHAIFGVSQSINSATFAVLRAISQVADIEGGRMLKPMLKDLEKLHVGQSWDLYWTFHMRCPSEDEYFRMVDGKTGGLFSLALRMMLLASDQHCNAGDSKAWTGISETLFSLTRLLGRFFQVRDDYLNLTASEYKQKKGTMEDLDEGKFSFPLILTIQSSPKNRDYMMGLLKWAERPLAKETKEFLVQLMKQSGALARTKDKIRSLQDDMEIQILDMEKIFGRENPVLRELVKKL